MNDKGGARRFRIQLERTDGTFTFDAPADEYLLYSMIDAGIESPHICEQGWCLACAARLLSGEVDRSGALTVYPEDAEAGLLLLCCTKPCSDLILMLDERQARREMVQHRIAHNQLARAYPPGARLRFRRGRATPRMGPGDWLACATDHLHNYSSQARSRSPLQAHPPIRSPQQVTPQTIPARRDDETVVGHAISYSMNNAHSYALNWSFE
ncbi:conserved hypothetical protein [Bradyrhizobium sp. STM 3843]|nr:conserved hypothetical protein [Bradyrhizobium sp. STM 3843]